MPNTAAPHGLALRGSPFVAAAVWVRSFGAGFSVPGMSVALSAPDACVAPLPPREHSAPVASLNAWLRSTSELRACARSVSAK